ncbi:MAG: hypothetical protein ACFFG0_56125, partial [Candidatus Thorarchaeota archaeon]
MHSHPLSRIDRVRDGVKNIIKVSTTISGRVKLGLGRFELPSGSSKQLGDGETINGLRISFDSIQIFPSFVRFQYYFDVRFGFVLNLLLVSNMYCFFQMLSKKVKLMRSFSYLMLILGIL